MKNVKILTIILTFLQCAAALIIPIAISFTLPGVKRGFFCHDPALSLPQLSDTVPNWLLFVWATSPILVLFVCEMLFNRKKCENIITCMNISWQNTSYLFHRYVINIALMHLIMFVAKYFTGSHRPHFFETCMPDVLSNCTVGTFIQSYKCTNTQVPFYKILDASQSFFSGHAAVCIYSCTFIAYYLQRRVKASNIFTLPLLQALLLSLGYFGAISRVFDHRHHVVDVTVGGIVGLLTTIHAWLYQCKHVSFEFQSLPMLNKHSAKVAPMEINSESYTENN